MPSQEFEKARREFENKLANANTEAIYDQAHVIGTSCATDLELRRALAQMLYTYQRQREDGLDKE